jgi:TupA-like ATPgrasp
MTRKPLFTQARGILSTIPLLDLFCLQRKQPSNRFFHNTPSRLLYWPPGKTSNSVYRLLAVNGAIAGQVSSDPPDCKESIPKPHPVLGPKASRSDTPLKALARRVLPPTLRKALHLLSDSSWQWLHDRVPDRFVQASYFKQTFGRDLNLAAPQTFNEKIQWLMLYYRIPEVTRLADKYEVRSYVAQQVGDWLLNDLYGTWDDASALVVDRLPESFVLKVTSGSTQSIFCRDKSLLDVERIRRQLAQWLKRSEYWRAREWCYKNIRPQIICERFLTDERGNIPSDFKFFCFDGEPRFVQLDIDRFGDHRRDFFDLKWKRLPFNIGSESSSGQNVQRPHNLETMILVARALSRGFPFVRVDLYSIREGVIFGEMTWYPGGGLMLFSPDSYDLQLGQALTLPKSSNSGLLRRLSSSTGWPSHS